MNFRPDNLENKYKHNARGWEWTWPNNVDDKAIT